MLNSMVKVTPYALYTQSSITENIIDQLITYCCTFVSVTSFTEMENKKKQAY